MTITTHERADILAEIAGRWAYSPFDLRAKGNRSATHSFLRHTVWAHLRFGWPHSPSLTEIGAEVGRDHTTVIFGMVSLACKIQRRRELSDMFDDIAFEAWRAMPEILPVRRPLLRWMKASDLKKKTARRPVYIAPVRIARAIA